MFKVTNVCVSDWSETREAKGVCNGMGRGGERERKREAKCKIYRCNKIYTISSLMLGHNHALIVFINSILCCLGKLGNGRNLASSE